MSPIRLSRTVEIPDGLRISRYRKSPELGPKVLFFSGGSALNSLCKTLKDYTHNSTHLVTPFDSGGSSAELRRAFGMPSIGDLRSRMMALADESVLGHPDIFRLFNHRFPKCGSSDALRAQLETMAQGKGELMSEIANPMRRLISNQLGYFLQAMPADFNLAGASIGNLILTGGYLNNHRHLDPIVFLFSKLVNVQGTVRAIVDEDLHLVAELEDGSRVIGQHALTGKEVPPLQKKVKRVFLSASASQPEPTPLSVRKKNRKLIESAELICYPPGSFYSSLLVNLLPSGVGRAIASNGCPKVYLPNLGRDPEQYGMTLDDCLDQLLAQLQADCGEEPTPVSILLNFILIDSRQGNYGPLPSIKRLEQLGISVIDTRLVSKASAPYYDNALLVAALMSLV